MAGKSKAPRICAAAMSGKLNPTLWRTCRVLANRSRLRMLQLLFAKPNLTVSDVASQTRVAPTVASLYLRSLNARGLILASRQGRWVCYRPKANRSVPGSTALLAALESALSGKGITIEKVFRQVTAFTHPRRLQLIQALAVGPASRTALMRVTHISRPALVRHLAKLRIRGYVVHRDGAYHIQCPQCRLAGVLLMLAGGVFSRPGRRTDMARV